MRTLTLNQETTKNLLEELLKRSPSSYTAYEDAVAEIVETVRKGGDAAVFSYTEKFDHAKMTPENLVVTEEEIAEAYREVEPKLL